MPAPAPEISAPLCLSMVVLVFANIGGPRNRSISSTGSEPHDRYFAHAGANAIDGRCDTRADELFFE